MDVGFAPYTGREDDSDLSLEFAFEVPTARWDEMKYFRRKTVPRDGATTHRRRLRGEPPLSAASLGSPIFVETWNGGSPLNWVEFMGRWETTRVDRQPPKDDD